MAAFATTVPRESFNVDTLGIAWPVGQVVKFPSAAGGITVKLKEYAWAVVGIPQELEGTGNVRVCWAVIEGGPNGDGNPAAARVSATRQGLTE